MYSVGGSNALHNTNIIITFVVGSNIMKYAVKNR